MEGGIAKYKTLFILSFRRFIIMNTKNDRNIINFPKNIDIDIRNIDTFLFLS